MKKQLYYSLIGCLIVVPFMGMHAQSTVAEGQSTEGKDFWVTFMRADQNDHSDAEDKAVTLALTVSAKEECDVTFTNPNTHESKAEHMTAGSIKEVVFYTGDAGSLARTRTDAKKASITCYTYYPDSVDNSAIQVTSTAPISLFASNRRSKSFDATNVLPTASLLDEYLIQSVAPSDHQNKPQGTHFSIIATEDNTVVDYCPTVELQCVIDAKSAYAFSQGVGMTPEQIALANWKVGDTLHTPVLNKGQVYYIWTGNNSGASADLSGTWLKARDSKKIAVFQGAPHTNLPDKIRDRDHLFSQAMPVSYWGNTFVITASMTRGRDIVRIMAREDGTEVRINGELKHTFNFASNPSRTFEFEIGKTGVKCTDSDYKKSHSDQTLPDPLVADSSCFITTSCPASTHLFMVSNTYDANPVGDPAMVWVNPIEQRINDITFATYGTSNTHYFNVVTDSAGVVSMQLDGKSISSSFSPVSGSNKQWFFARKNIAYGTHHLTGANGFIAHVYGYGNKESYGYSAGGATKPLTQFITINGQIFTPDSKNTLCGDDTIRFACHPDYEYEKIEWYFGDGESNLENQDSVPHEYKQAGVYNAYVLIYRNSSNVCKGQNVVDRIPITVTIGNYKVDVLSVDMPDCTLQGDEVDLTIHLANPSNVSLTGDSVSIDFTKVATDDGLTKDKLTIKNDSTLIIHLPGTVKDKKEYGLHIHIGSDCPNSVLDKDLTFEMHFDKPYLTQRYNNVLGILRDSFPNQELTDIVWIHDGDTIPDEHTAVLHLEDTESNNGEYHVCFNVHEEGKADYTYCTCPITFKASDKKHEFQPDSLSLALTASYAIKDDKVFVNADWNGKTDIECYAEWITTGGKVYQGLKFNLPDGGCTIPVPAENGLYLLRVYTDGKSRSFKFIIDK